MWNAYIFDTMTGRIDVPIDIPSFSWDLTVSSSSLSISSDKGTGKADASGLKLPWSAIPADNQGARNKMLAPYRRSIILCYVSPDGKDYPVVGGMIGPRTDTWEDTSFDLVSIMDFMANRLIVREGVFGKARGGTTTDVISYNNMSLRGILADIGTLCTHGKPGGQLPIDWNYNDEKGSHQRTYPGYNVQNQDFESVATKIANVNGGPDITFRPYFYDTNHIRWSFLAGSDSIPYLDSPGIRPTFQAFPGGGSLDEVSIDMATPFMRTYVTGSGSDDATLCVLAQNLKLSTSADPWPLVEETYSSTDDDNLSILTQHANGRLAAGDTARFQLSGKWNAGDTNAPKPGMIWPGQTVMVQLSGHPTVPDGDYLMRIMEMSGDQSQSIDVTFDTMTDERW
jgi:hypothetical protein